MKNSRGRPAEVFAAFLKLGLTSFGGPIAHLGYFRKELVERRKWVSESQFSQLLAICQFLPGPASSQLGFSLGLARAGWLGGLAAFIAFTLPSALLLIGFASLLPALSGPVGEAATHGLKIVAFAVVADAVLGMSKKLCPDIQRATIAILSAGVLLVVGNAWIQLLVVIGGAIAGIYLCRGGATQTDSQIPIHYGRKLGGILLLLFFGLLAGLPLFSTQNASLISMAEAFYRAGALVFGGGHVVLPLLEDSVVSSGWITSETFLAGYGASQAIPGPVFAFSAYLGVVTPTGHNEWLGASIALIFMFMPGFLLVAGVLPFWRAISHNTAVARAVAGVNAAVVGLLAAALYDPIFISAIQSGADMAIGIVAFAMLFVWRLSAIAVVVWSVVASILIVLV
ncbi:MAG: chromate efflux transporter [Pseudomonadota bacterium]|nr:chromate efflux transporter [Pseudomonadota bacterium]MDO7711327.1 chromate efflux transporter [Pseudomonadota bacterium]